MKHDDAFLLAPPLYHRAQQNLSASPSSALKPQLLKESARHPTMAGPVKKQAQVGKNGNSTSQAELGSYERLLLKYVQRRNTAKA